MGSNYIDFDQVYNIQPEESGTLYYSSSNPIPTQVQQNNYLASGKNKPVSLSNAKPIDYSLYFATPELPSFNSEGIAGNEMAYNAMNVDRAVEIKEGLDTSRYNPSNFSPLGVHYTKQSSASPISIMTRQPRNRVEKSIRSINQEAEELYKAKLQSDSFIKLRGSEFVSTGYPSSSHSKTFVKPSIQITRDIGVMTGPLGEQQITYSPSTTPLTSSPVSATSSPIQRQLSASSSPIESLTPIASPRMTPRIARTPIGSPMIETTKTGFVPNPNARERSESATSFLSDISVQSSSKPPSGSVSKPKVNYFVTQYQQDRYTKYAKNIINKGGIPMEIEDFIKQSNEKFKGKSRK